MTNSETTPVPVGPSQFLARVDGINLTAQDVATLDGTMWLNDNVRKIYAENYIPKRGASHPPVLYFVHSL